MHISATFLKQWADTRSAQDTLPHLIRRLVSRCESIRGMAIPSGDSVGRPGWDGEIEIEKGNAWVPSGQSRWECGCSQNPRTKANLDYNDRVDEPDRASKTFVFVTPRRWDGKNDWAEEKRSEERWKDVRAYDGDDLEAWIETEAGVSLWFAEKLGLAGDGIESVEQFWARWANQSQHAISHEAISYGRQAAATLFSEHLETRPRVVIVQADSREEAAAFASSRIIVRGLQDLSAGVNSPLGWRFVAMNPNIQLAVAASAEAAADAPIREGLTVIVPMGAGDGLTGRQPAANAKPVVLARIPSRDFEQALITIGVVPSDAARLSRASGRSWAVYRRLQAQNPAIRSPAWLTGPAIDSLASLCLVGCWNADRAGDRACVEAVSGKPYEIVEQELQDLALVDDSPVVRIGTVWKAKASIELLFNLGPRLTQSQIHRFFDVALSVLTKPDPALELDPDKRWMANVYGKVRDESGLAIDAITDSLARLAVHAEAVGGNNAQDLIDRTNSLVRELLHDADKERWLSLGGVLRELAEAAPDEFLSAIEASLSRSDTPVIELIRETSDGVFGRCTHADLLWSLEVLAWEPRHLARVSLILIRLSEVPVPGNWANTPLNTLKLLFLSWMPQTTATVERRLAVLDRLIERNPQPAWNLVLELLPAVTGGIASPNATPRWREYNAGFSRAVLRSEMIESDRQIAERALQLADRTPARIEALFDHVDALAPDHQQKFVELVKAATSADDEERETIRARLRKYLHWHNSFNSDGGQHSRFVADELSQSFDALASPDLARRHAWIFESDWVDTPDGGPDGYEERSEQLEALRAQAMQEIFRSEGWDGLTRLAHQSGNQWAVGGQASRLYATDPQLLTWAIERWQEADQAPHDALLSSVLSFLPEEEQVATVRRTVEERFFDEPAVAAAFLCNAPFRIDIWNLLSFWPEPTGAAYWSMIRPHHAQDDALKVAVESLIDAERHRTAFTLVRHNLEKVSPTVVFEILDGIRAGKEPDGPIPDGYTIGKAQSTIVSSKDVSMRQVALLEFAYYDALRQGGRKRSGFLIAEMLDDPSLFVDCLCLVYKPSTGDPQPQADGLEQVVSTGWKVLHDGRGIPGMRDGSIDRHRFDNWIATARQLAAEQDRAEVADSTIGQWLSDGPTDDDETWPCLPVRDLLEGDDAQTMRSSFCTGVYNNRGMTSRAYGDGGQQERELADMFDARADRVASTHPQVAAMLTRIAASYRREATSHDDDAQLRRELD